MHLRNLTASLCSGLILVAPQLVRAEIERPLPHPIGEPRQPAVSSPGGGSTGGNAWTPLTHQPTFLADGAANPILLTDGSVLVQDAGFPDWWRLTPDQHGSYINGTWTQVASLPATYSPLYHASAVLPDGRLIIEGGEDLLSVDQTEFISTWSAQGAIFDPLANTWTPIAPPPFFTGFGPFPQTIGDAQSVVLASGTFMLANCCSAGKESALLDARTLTWTRTGAGKFDDFDEEGWTLLPDGKVLTSDAFVGVPYDPNGTASEIYDPATGAWSSAGSTVTQLWDSAAACGGERAGSFEVGPAVLRPDGTVFSTGGNACGAAHTAIYDSKTGTWTAGPDFPDGLGIADGPAALEPNGKVLMMASPGTFNSPSTFLEWDGTALSEIPGPPNAPSDSSFFGSMLVLPTGQILLCDFSNDIEIFTPTATPPRLEAAERPLVAFTPVILQPGGSYEAFGVRFNGVSQGAAYGDDFQAATNYPIIRIKNLATGHVFYSRTHDHSSMAVASTRLVSTHFDVPARQERGLSVLEVVANGVASPPVFVVVR
jgi:hypothetical protein